MNASNFTVGGQSAKLAIWQRFCRTHRIAEKGVPLFSCDNSGAVEVFAYGRDSRALLRRSPDMRSLVINSVRAALEKPASDAEGLLYMMHRVDTNGGVIPCYIGKAGRHGRSGTNISANWINVDRDEAKFARWGYNYGYHLGDLSAAALPGHAASRISPQIHKVGQVPFPGRAVPVTPAAP